MKFYRAKTLFGASIVEIIGITPEAFIKDMVKYGVLKEVSGNYSDDCYDLCRNAVTWLAARLVKSGVVEEADLTIHDGNFYGRRHCWVEMGDFFLDLTLAQFSKTAPQFSIVKKSTGLKAGYDLSEQYKVADWVENVLKFG